jgi:NADPH:quinone reductase-like Zn-dependent oxidoreductase
VKAVAIDRFKELGSLREMPDPVLDPDAVIIRVTRAGINPIDWKVRDGLAGERAFPFILGQDVAGVVNSVGSRISRVKPGDRVFGCGRERGGYAELTMIHEGRHDSPFTTIPDSVTDTQAAALPTPGLTALGAIELLEVTKATTLLIVGAGGSVGGISVQIAHHRGAHVTGVVRPGQANAVRQLGADETSESTAALLGAIGNGTAQPFDAVLDLVSDGETLKKNATLVKKGGKLVTTIHVADEKWFAQHGIEATNIGMAETPQSSPEGLNQLTQMVVDGTLTVDVAAEKPLEEGPQVLDDVKSGKLPGKVVLVVP